MCRIWSPFLLGRIVRLGSMGLMHLTWWRWALVWGTGDSLFVPWWTHPLLGLKLNNENFVVIIASFNFTLINCACTPHLLIMSLCKWISLP
jgi:hypothetical protein